MQVTAQRLKVELNEVSRKSCDEVWAVAGLQNVYRDLTSCCSELAASLNHDVDRLLAPKLVSAQVVSGPQTGQLLRASTSKGPPQKNSKKIIT